MLTLFLSKTASAVNLDSTSYKIKFGNINMGGGNETSTSYKLGTTLGQTAPGEFNSTGYTIKSGFQYIHSIIPFAFSVSNTHIVLGTLTAGTFASATTDLTVSFGSAGTYQVTAQELDTLKTLSGNSIPDTQCDSGVPCTSPSTAQPWTSTSRYGFGYNMSGNDIPTDFINSTYYRPFNNFSTSDNPIVVMSSTNVGKNRLSTMTFRVNVSGIQPAGNYQNVISFVATPSY
jgi:hypothetical protein